MKPMMECGHAANAVITSTNAPCCVICAGDPRSVRIAAVPPVLVGRSAACSYCKALRPSDTPSLAFFEYQGEGSRRAQDTCKCSRSFQVHAVEHMAKLAPNRDGSRRRTVVEEGRCAGFTPKGAAEFDNFYCGCRGWD